MRYAREGWVNPRSIHAACEMEDGEEGERGPASGRVDGGAPPPPQLVHRRSYTSLCISLSFPFVLPTNLRQPPLPPPPDRSSNRDVLLFFFFLFFIMFCFISLYVVFFIFRVSFIILYFFQLVRLTRILHVPRAELRQLHQELPFMLLFFCFFF